MNPCDNCKKKPKCPDRCFPKMDYERGQKKRRRNGKHEQINRQNPRGRGEGAGGNEKMTWGDRIRAMTYEELADWLKYERISVCPPDTGHIHCNVSDICADRKCWLDWLKQEVNNG